MRHEVFTGPERRRRWSVEEVGVNGWTVSDVARRHDVGRQNIYHWRRELRRKGLWPRGARCRCSCRLNWQRPNLSALPPTGAKRPSVDEVTIVLSNGRQVRCRADLPETELTRLIRAVEAA